MKKQAPKLQINSLTVRDLTPEALKAVLGGRKIGISCSCNNTPGE